MKGLFEGMNIDLVKAEEDLKLQFEALPEGKYKAQIEKIEKKTSKNTGQDYLSIQYSLIGEENGGVKNRKVFQSLFPNSDHPVAQDIASKTLVSLAHSTGQKIKDVQEKGVGVLLNKPLVLNLKAKPGRDGVLENSVSFVQSFKEDLTIISNIKSLNSKPSTPAF